jgi:hypothetical protein
MLAVFPTEEWLKELKDRLNYDPRYVKGDLSFVVEQEGHLKEWLTLYLDL